jgi:hypothetical protein
VRRAVPRTAVPVLEYRRTAVPVRRYVQLAVFLYRPPVYTVLHFAPRMVLGPMRGWWRSAAALVAATAATGARSQFQIMPSPCPSGMSYITSAQAQAQSAQICAMIGQWSIAEVGSHLGPGLSGSGYQCNFNPSACGDGSCQESVCVPGGSGGDGGSADDEATTTELWAILTFVIISVYMVGGVAYNKYTGGELTHPHWKYWRQTGGLVKDGVKFTQAKYNGTQSGEQSGAQQPFPAAAEQHSSYPGAAAGARAGGYSAPQPAAAARVAAAPAPEVKKKKKKKVKMALEDAAAAPEKTKKKKKKKKTSASADDAEAKE